MFNHSHALPLVAWLGLITAAFEPPIAAAFQLPPWGGLLFAAIGVFGTPLFAGLIVERFSPTWADHILEWHMRATIVAFCAIVVIGGGVILRRWIES